jgi:hypothetical protein
MPEAKWYITKRPIYVSPGNKQTIITLPTKSTITTVTTEAHYLSTNNGIQNITRTA